MKINTIMRLLSSKYIYIIIFFLYPIFTFGNIETDTTKVENIKDTIVIRDTIYLAPISIDNDDNIRTQISKYTNKHDRRVHRYRDFWGILIPTNFKIQYAGGMGLLSFGPGWDYGKRGQWETDLMFGYVPAYSTPNGKLVMTLKQNYIPFSVYLFDKFDLEPLSCGIYFTTIFGDDFWAKEPGAYPKNYYGFATKIRANIYLGQRISYQLPEKIRMLAKSVTFYYELSSCDLYIVNAITNSSMRPQDYLRLSVGIKFQIF